MLDRTLLALANQRSAGSPLSYWDGVHGRNPMRYSGGLLGGSWLIVIRPTNNFGWPLLGLLRRITFALGLGKESL
jgi:hypothetical protein